MNLIDHYRAAVRTREKIRERSEAERAEILRDLGAKLRNIREARGYSLADVAGAASVTSGFLSQIELGHRTPTPEIIRVYRGMERKSDETPTPEKQ